MLGVGGREGEGVAPYVRADGILQRSEPVVERGVVIGLDEQLCALLSLQLQPGDKQHL